MGKTVVIVGSGMGGLSAGIYSRLNGLDAEILEQQPVPGGLVQSWQRGRFLLDGCVHWIAGSTGWPSTFQSLYRDLGFLPRTTKDGTSVAGISFLHFDEFSRFEPSMPISPEERSRLEQPVVFSSDISQCCLNLYEAAERRYPGRTVATVAADKKLIDWMMKSALQIANGDMADPSDHLLKAGFKMLFRFGLRNIFSVFRYAYYTMDDVASLFKSPLLQTIFRNIWTRQCPVVYFWFVLAWCHRKSVGFPLGGSRTLAQVLHRRFTELGGKSRFNTRVTQIVIQNDRVTGVKLLDGTTVPCDYLIWACDGHTLLFDLLKQHYMDHTLRTLWNESRVIEGVVLVLVGLSHSRVMEVSGALGLVEPAGMRSNASGSVVELRTPAIFAGERQTNVLFHLRGPESGLVLPEPGETTPPSDSCVVTMLFGSHFHPWLALARAGTLTEGTATNASTNMTTAVAQGKLHGVKDVPDMSAIMGYPSNGVNPSFAAIYSGTDASGPVASAQGPAQPFEGMGGLLGPHEPHAYARNPAYVAEKFRIAQWARQFLVDRYGDNLGQIEVCEVLTPLSFHRYTANYLGSQNGWLQRAGLGMMLNNTNARPVPGLKGAFMAGHWVAPVGGVPTSLMSGRDAALFAAATSKSEATATTKATRRKVAPVKTAAATS